MTDRELIELAAKSIGLTLRYNYLGTRDANQPWDPLADDGDALRLAVKLGIDISTAQIDFYDKHSSDPYAATRRAITRAAAEIRRAA